MNNLIHKEIFCEGGETFTFVVNRPASKLMSFIGVAITLTCSLYIFVF
jgi:hypothetical protein